MRLGLISQIKNEIDIIVPFLEHIDSLFDCVFLLDHQSIDGTTDLLKQAVSLRNSWKYYYLNFKGKNQQKVANFFIPKIFMENIDYLFLLDADEFLFVENRKTLEKNLSRLMFSNQVGRLQWINSSPTTFENKDFGFSTPLLQSPYYSFYGKVVIPKTIYLRDPNITVGTGNHHVKNTNKEVIPEFDIGKIIHIPIRSKDQAIRKAIVNGITKAANNHPTPGNYKYNECLKMIANGELDNQGLKKLIHIYENTTSRDDHQDFINKYWTKAQTASLNQLNIPKSNTLKLDQSINYTKLHTIIADLLLSQNGNSPFKYNLILDQNIVHIADSSSYEASESREKTLYSSTKQKHEKVFKDSSQAKVKSCQNKLKRIKQSIVNLQNQLQSVSSEIRLNKIFKYRKITKPLRTIMKLLKQIE